MTSATPAGSMIFENVLHNLKQGRSLTREGWNGKGLFITLQVPDAGSKMTRPYIYMTAPAGSTAQFDTSSEHRVPWLPSQTDLFAEDWKIL